MNAIPQLAVAAAAAQCGRLRALLAACCLLALCGCLQRADYDIPVDVKAAGQQAQWQLAGSFGGEAVVEQQSADPWQVRFKPGGFVETAGICVTDSEVWVCDLGISRIQIFDYDGNYLRSTGEGVPIAGTLLTDKQLYAESNSRPKDPALKWENGPGARWVGQEGKLFKAADVAVTAQGIVFADWAQTSVERSPKRHAGVYLVNSAGGVVYAPDRDINWPSFLAVAGTTIAFADPPGNVLTVGDMTDEKWPLHKVTAGNTFDRIMDAKTKYSGTDRYLKAMELASNASSEPGKFDGLGGVALAFDKLVACDSANYRLQVFETRRADFNHWGRLIRVIPAQLADGGLRFEAPLDVDVSNDGTVFVLNAARLDKLRNEIAVLNSRFERIGAFGKNELMAPVAVDVSPDGRHCFVSDRRSNLVYHYVAAD